MQHQYINGNEIVYGLTQFRLLLRRSGNILLLWQHLPTGFADILRQVLVLSRTLSIGKKREKSGRF